MGNLVFRIVFFSGCTRRTAIVDRVEGSSDDAEVHGLRGLTHSRFWPARGMRAMLEPGRVLPAANATMQPLCRQGYAQRERLWCVNVEARPA